jgi:hypothetical protein
VTKKEIAIPVVAIAFVLFTAGCHQRGLAPAATQYPASNASVQKKKPVEHTLPCVAKRTGDTRREKKAALLSGIPVLNKVGALADAPIIKEIKSVPKVIDEIPILNKVAHYFKTRPSKSYRRVKNLRNNDTESSTGSDRTMQNDPNTQHFSGGLDYDETIYLKSINVTKADTNTLIKLNTTNICRYAIDYIDPKQRIEILLNGCQNMLKDKKIVIPPESIIKESRIYSVDRNTTKIVFALKQHAKLNVIEAYAPTYLLIDITPMYPLFATPAR